MRAFSGKRPPNDEPGVAIRPTGEVIHAICRHPVHPFPARMAPEIVWDVLRTGARGPLTVLDPMVGSGTSLAVAKAMGHRAIGVDSDPLAVLMSRVWCSDVDPQLVREKTKAVLRRARADYTVLSLGAAYPRDTDEETKAFVRYWFDRTSRRQLAALASAIRRVSSDSIRDALWCAFSRMIVVKSCGVSLAMDIAHSRPHRVYDTAPRRPFVAFEGAVNQVLRAMPFASCQPPLPSSRVLCADARQLPLKEGEVDSIVTSPPYLNAIDYMRGHKLSLVWMGHRLGELRKVRSTNVGAEVSAGERIPPRLCQALEQMGDLRSLDARQKGIIVRYISDMDKTIGECSRVLKKRGRAAFVIGDSCVSGTFVKNSGGLACLAEQHGLQLVSQESRTLADNRRYLPPPSHQAAGNALQRRMREEVILVFVRGDR